MSYILEALKKAQAERQLGSAPTIHAPAAAAVPESNAVSKPIVAGAAAGVLIVATGLFAWHRQPAPVQVAAVVPAAKPAPAPVREPAVVEQAPPAAHVALVGQADPPPKPAEPVAVATAHAPAASAKTVAAEAVKPVAARPAPVQVASVAPAPVPVQPAATAAPASDDNVRGLNELPEAVRSGLPKVAFGGYMYSPNPADRLVLVDNILRREGEEVAPGLVLEKLLPKGAVMNYRGYRYRVPF